MVYSIGIVDYLNDILLKKVIAHSYKKLKPGGKLILAYKDIDAHRPIELNWYVDWNFVPRNENEFIQLIKNTIGEEKISIAVEREHSGIIFFAIVTKNS